MKFIKFDTAYQKQSNGEMYVPSSDGAEHLIKTGYFFERVTQALPILGGQGKIVGYTTVNLSPWAFATTETAMDVFNQLRLFTSNAYKLSLTEGDFDNGPFPRSHKEWQIQAEYSGKKARINAGLLASNIARTTAFVDGKVKQFPEPCLKDAAMELTRELERIED